jgi:hypothetical protein
LRIVSCGIGLDGSGPGARVLLGCLRLLLLLEQILEDELTPNAAACVHQRATLVQLSQLDGCESELFGKSRYGSDRILVVARQKDDSMHPLDDRIGRQGGRSEVIETFHQLGASERLCAKGGRLGKGDLLG